MDSQLESETSNVTLGRRTDVKIENEDVNVQVSHTKHERQGVSSMPPLCCTKEREAQQLVHEQDHSRENHKRFQSGIQFHEVLQDSTLEHCAENGSFDQNQTVNHMNFDGQETQGNTYPDVQLNACHTIQKDHAVPSEKVEIDSWSSNQNPRTLDIPQTSRVKNFTGSLCSNPKNTSSSIELAVTAIKMKKEIPDNCDDVLDHIVLKERQKMLLLKRNSLKSADSGPEQGSSASSSGEIREQSPAKGIEESQSSVNDILPLKFLISGSTERETSIFVPQTASANEIIATSKPQPEMMKSMNMENQQSESTLLAEGTPMEFSAYRGESALSSNKNVFSSSELPASFNIKDEPWDCNELHLKENAINLFPVKSEPNVSNETDEDQVEDMFLLDRIKSLSSGKDSNSTGPANNINASMSAQPVGTNRLRKRKKTATDSVETALEEDVPGLLQILKEKGVSVDEIKLFGETESDEALDESLCTDSFAELEAVMSKLFCQRQSLLKFAPLRYTKASRANYCLACLISLVEQSRYLQFRKLPVVWGWCRDLQSFIFVFEKHNRLVLERPEYGYATYFFELLNSLPIDWQIKRLVVTMKLSSFSRISLIENKALMVGEDLTEGEARVLMEYGWVPNTGLGTMLNYCDRVVHSQNNENTSEWRSKIGKLLVDGYNGGTMVAPKKVIGSSCMQEQEIKLETD